MQFYFISAALFCMVQPIAFSPTAHVLPDDSVIHIAFYAPVHEKPLPSSVVITVCEDGTPVKLLAVDGQWLYIAHRSYRGWIQDKYAAEWIGYGATSDGKVVKKTKSVFKQGSRFTKTILIIAMVSIGIAAYLFSFHRRWRSGMRTICRSAVVSSGRDGHPHQSPHDRSPHFKTYLLDGTIVDNSLYDIVQLLETNKKTGFLHIHDTVNNQKGAMYFEKGIIT